MERKDLSTASVLEGTLGYGTPIPLKIAGTGTITWLPEAGRSLDRNSQLLRIDERPLVVFLGSTPLYRPLDVPGLRGADVSMVASNLKALGLLNVADPAKAVTGVSLSAALRAWQKNLGLEPTGTIAPGDVQVLPEPSRVASVTSRVGDAPGESLTVTGLTKTVVVDVPASRAGAVAVDAPVTATLVDGTKLSGHVASVATVINDGQDASAEPTLGITIALDDQAATGDTVASPVSVSVAAETRIGALVVPIAALLALREGGYALQTPSGSLLAVTTGLFAGDFVEVSGKGVTEGLTVVTAR
ncbi:peptidoglycan-binding protein [Lacisediminihabitans sp. FW035]